MRVKSSRNEGFWVKSSRNEGFWVKSSRNEGFWTLKVAEMRGFGR